MLREQRWLSAQMFDLEVDFDRELQNNFQPHQIKGQICFPISIPLFWAICLSPTVYLMGYSVKTYNLKCSSEIDESNVNKELTCDSFVVVVATLCLSALILKIMNTKTYIMVPYR